MYHERSCFDAVLLYYSAVRVAFLKARARCHRWTEEVRLVKAEQTRVLVTLEKQALRWETRAVCDHEPDQTIREGMIVYAREQAGLRRLLSQTFAKLWSMPITEMGLYTLDDDGREEDEVVPPMIPGEEAEEEAEEEAVDTVIDIADVPDSDSDDLGLESDSEDEL